MERRDFLKIAWGAVGGVAAVAATAQAAPASAASARRRRAATRYSRCPYRRHQRELGRPGLARGGALCPSLAPPSLASPRVGRLSTPRRAGRHALILVAEKRGPTMLPRIGVLRALHRNETRVFNFRPQRSALEEAEAEAGRMKVKRNDPSAGAS
jgi:hypothetical protein